MNSSEIAVLITGLPQFSVATHALRLNRPSGIARVGWSLFWVFFLMALIHLVQAAPSVRGRDKPGILDTALYAIISMLLITGMARLESVLRRWARVEREGKGVRAELECIRLAHLDELGAEANLAGVTRRNRADMSMADCWHSVQASPT